ncbi:MAG: hypothetical protein HF973_19065 [Chloroflexi bacterium]|nr:hypothetical protein [Chloroflexota bacterium]
MSRKANQANLDQIRDAIEAHPEHKPGWFARFLGRDNKSIMRALPQLEERGDLLMEDDDGRISWYGRRR